MRFCAELSSKAKKEKTKAGIESRKVGVSELLAKPLRHRYKHYLICSSIFAHMQMKDAFWAPHLSLSIRPSV